MNNGKVSFFDNISDHSKSLVLNENDEEDSDSDLEIVPALKTYTKVIQTSEDVAYFIDSKSQ